MSYKGSKKNCPLSKNAAWKCIKTECAWYLVKSKQCAIPLIASEMQKRRKTMETILSVTSTRKVKPSDSL